MALSILNDGDLPDDTLLARARNLPAGRPIIVMIHGYRFCPLSPRHDPHRHILSLDPPPDQPRALSWPARLGLSATGDEGLGLAFGWSARGRLRDAYRRAAPVGERLAERIAEISSLAERPVGIIAHSLGARVALQALTHAAPGSIHRMVLLTGAEFRDVALAAHSSPSARGCEIFNITTRENDLFDFGFEMTLSAGRRVALGAGLSEARAGWLDIQIDDPETRAALGEIGYPIAGPTLRACHWSPYLRPGLMTLYRAALATPERLPLAWLGAQLPDRTAPRWSGLWARPIRGSAMGRAQAS